MLRKQLQRVLNHRRALPDCLKRRREQIREQLILQSIPRLPGCRAEFPRLRSRKRQRCFQPWFSEMVTTESTERKLNGQPHLL